MSPAVCPRCHYETSEPTPEAGLCVFCTMTVEMYQKTGHWFAVYFPPAARVGPRTEPHVIVSQVETEAETRTGGLHPEDRRVRGEA